MASAPAPIARLAGGRRQAPVPDRLPAPLLAGLAVALAGQFCIAAATATGCPEEYAENEGVRAREFLRIHKQWPPNLTYPGAESAKESKAWRDFIDKKRADVMAIEKSSWRWERWLELAQIQVLANFTTLGWGLGRMPAKVHARVLNHFRAEYRNGLGGSKEKGDTRINGSLKIVNAGSLKTDVSSALLPLVAEWAGLSPDSIEPTSTYGIRVYSRGSTLQTHVDRVETHVLSAVYMVDCEYDAYHEGSVGSPWNMEYDPDFSGRHGTVAMRPGDLFFYESAKLPHGRPSELQGNFSAHMFVHFRPKGWDWKNVDRTYAVPPKWNAPAEKPPGGPGHGEL